MTLRRIALPFAVVLGFMIPSSAGARVTVDEAPFVNFIFNECTQEFVTAVGWMQQVDNFVRPGTRGFILQRQYTFSGPGEGLFGPYKVWWQAHSFQNSVVVAGRFSRNDTQTWRVIGGGWVFTYTVNEDGVVESSCH